MRQRKGRRYEMDGDETLARILDDDADVTPDLSRANSMMLPHGGSNSPQVTTGGNSRHSRTPSRSGLTSGPSSYLDLQVGQNPKALDTKGMNKDMFLLTLRV